MRNGPGENPGPFPKVGQTIMAYHTPVGTSITLPGLFVKGSRKSVGGVRKGCRTSEQIVGK